MVDSTHAGLQMLLLKLHDLSRSRFINVELCSGEIRRSFIMHRLSATLLEYSIILIPS